MAAADTKAGEEIAVVAAIAVDPEAEAIAAGLAVADIEVADQEVVVATAVDPAAVDIKDNGVKSQISNSKSGTGNQIESFLFLLVKISITDLITCFFLLDESLGF